MKQITNNQIEVTPDTSNREGLEEAARNYYVSKFGIGNSSMSPMLGDVCNAFKAGFIAGQQVKPVSEWVLFIDECPKKNIEILAHHETGGTVLAILNEDNLLMVFFASGLKIADDQNGYTHWMLKPTNP